MHAGCCETLGKRNPKVKQHPKRVDHAILHEKPFGNFHKLRIKNFRAGLSDSLTVLGEIHL